MVLHSWRLKNKPIGLDQSNWKRQSKKNVSDNEFFRDYFINCELKLIELQKEADFKYINRRIAREEAMPMLDTYDDCIIMNGKTTGKYDHANEQV